MFLEEYQKQLKNLLEEPDGLKRKVVYYGVGLGFVDYILNYKMETDSINQLNLILKVEKDVFLGKIVELTIVNSVDMETAILDLINYKIYTIRPEIGTMPTVTCTYDLFSINKFISPYILDAMDRNTDLFNKSRFTTITYLKEVEKSSNNAPQPIKSLKTPEESGISLSVVGPKS